MGVKCSRIADDDDDGDDDDNDDNDDDVPQDIPKHCRTQMPRFLQVATTMSWDQQGGTGETCYPNVVLCR